VMAAGFGLAAQLVAVWVLLVAGMVLWNIFGRTRRGRHRRGRGC
jgi:hypothetical protein